MSFDDLFRKDRPNQMLQITSSQPRGHSHRPERYAVVTPDESPIARNHVGTHQTGHE
jgi:hypothetical protein